MLLCVIIIISISTMKACLELPSAVVEVKSAPLYYVDDEITQWYISCKDALKDMTSEERHHMRYCVKSQVEMMLGWEKNMCKAGVLELASSLVLDRTKVKVIVRISHNK
jgi:hypothetical protein